MNTVWYFAYGSNMSRAIFEGRRQMRPLAAQVGWVEGHRVCFTIPIGPGERGVANLEPCAPARTHGVAYAITPEDFDRLDHTEGVPVKLYERVAITVHVGGGAALEAFTYRSALVSAGRKPSARYLGLLLDGARDHGLPDHYVALLRAIELAVDEREGLAPSRSESSPRPLANRRAGVP